MLDYVLAVRFPNLMTRGDSRPAAIAQWIGGTFVRGRSTTEVQECAMRGPPPAKPSYREFRPSEALNLRASKPLYQLIQRAISLNG